MKRTPMETPRSAWTEDVADGIGPYWRRRVNDGTLISIVRREPTGWHLSISFRDHRGVWSRYPRWDEIADARYRLMPDDIEVAMILPPPEDYVSLHETTFHLHELRPEQLPKSCQHGDGYNCEWCRPSSAEA